jgi:hypothetical protein
MSATTPTRAVDPRTAARITRNLELSEGFSEAMLANMDVLAEIPNGSTLVLLPADDPETFEYNLQTAIRAARDGENVYLRQVTSDGRPK